MHEKSCKGRKNRAPSAALSAAESLLQRRNSPTFGGRTSTFGGRKSYYYSFGCTFGIRKSRPETKLNLRRHFRRPNVHDRSESPASGSSLRQPKPPPQGFRRPNLPSAAEPGFARRAETCSASCTPPPIPLPTCTHNLSTCIYTCTCPKGSKTRL